MDVHICFFCLSLYIKKQQFPKLLFLVFPSPLMESLLKWNRPQNLSLSLQDAVVHHQFIHGVVALPEVCEGPEEHQVECGDHQAEVTFRKLSTLFFICAVMTLFLMIFLN